MMESMKKQLLMLTAAGILLLSACAKSADEVVPDNAIASSEISSGEGKGKCDGPKPQGPPPPEKVMTDLDLDQDRQISKAETKGPLVNDFDRIDSNKDGFVTLEELKAGGPPKQ